MSEIYVTTSNLVINQRDLNHREHVGEDRNFILDCFPNEPDCPDDPRTPWECGVVEMVERNRMETPVMFAISKHAFVWISDHMHLDSPEMKAGHIMREIWMYYRRHMRNLETVVYRAILDKRVVRAMKNATLALRTLDNRYYTSNQWLVVTPGRIGWAQAARKNHVITSMEEFLNENQNSLNPNARIQQVEFIWRQDVTRQDPFVDSHLHLKIQLTRQTHMGAQ